MDNLYIGIMTGTSLDGTDIVCANFSSKTPQVIKHQHFELPEDIRNQVLQLYKSPQTTINFLQTLRQNSGIYFAETCNNFIRQNNIDPQNIKAIGCHGITIDHQPDATPAYSVQIGSGHQIAFHTGRPTVVDFRMGDIVAGGQGAPIAPIFHQAFFGHDNNNIIVNIGGIANVSVLSQGEFGFDTGPGNRLIDDWCQLQFKQAYDHKGELARQGSINKELLNTLLADEYFSKQPPKSSGREYFNLRWLQSRVAITQYKPLDILATLTALTAISISQSVQPYINSASKLICCGGGTHNDYLIELLQQELPHNLVTSTDKEYHIRSEEIEALGFAYLAKLRLLKQSKMGVLYV